VRQVSAVFCNVGQFRDQLLAYRRTFSKMLLRLVGLAGVPESRAHPVMAMSQRGAVFGHAGERQHLQGDATVVRLCEQAYQQGALLSNADLAELMTGDDSRISNVLTAHERKTGNIVPRRATLHDVGCGVTHKRIICWKRYAEGKSSDQIAHETHHTVEAVDRYLGQFDRVRHCRTQEMTTAETAFTLNCSRRLVEEYLRIDHELEAREENDDAT